MYKVEKISLKDIIYPIKNELENFELELKIQLKSELFSLHPLCDYIQSSKGKRIRPILFFLSQGLLSKPDMNTTTIAVFLEILHTATLIHDDVIDNAFKRRERETMNVLWGNRTAVLFGDYLFAKVLELGVATQNLKILEVISKVVKKIGEGELSQVFNNRRIEKDIYYNMIKGKTAALFKASCVLAGLSQSVTEEILIRLGRFGELFGIVYQIKDDILDYSGKTELLGKPVKQDLSDGKFTLPFIMVYNKVTQKEKVYLQNLITDYSTDNLKILCDFIRDNKGVKLAEQELVDINQQAVKILKSFNSSIYRDTLEKLLKYNYSRKK